MAGTIGSWSHVEAGGFFTCGQSMDDGKLHCWGDNYSGQLGAPGACAGPHCTTNLPGDPVASDQTPDILPGLNYPGGESLSVGYDSTCMRLADGKPRCWGYNYYGELGVGTYDPGATHPVDVQFPGGTPPILRIDAGYEHACALTTEGTVYCWGDNNWGELGLGNLTDPKVNVPTLVPSLAGVVDLQVGWATTCALLVDGNVKCWGYNYDEEIPGQQDTAVDSPTQIPGGPYAQLAIGGFDACALKQGEAFCWGANSEGQLAHDTNGAPDPTPTSVGLSDVTQISPGTFFTCAVAGSDDSLECWGYNTNGDYGDGTTTPSISPKLIQTGYSGDIATGYVFQCRTSYGYLACAGDNHLGQLGGGSSASTSALLLYTSAAEPRSFTANYQNACQIGVDGTIECWGYNQNGQVGNGTSNGIEDSPVAVLNLPCTSADADDNNFCTADTCDPYAGVLHLPANSGLSCGGDFCSGIDTCDDYGHCLPGTAPTVDDGNDCTLDSCDAGTQQITNDPAPYVGNTCSADACHTGSTCGSDGSCGTPVPVDDGNPCTDDQCDLNTGGVSHTPVPNSLGMSCGTDMACDGGGHCVGTSVNISPPDLVAPPLDPTVPGSFSDSTSYLYGGSGVQVGAVTGGTEVCDPSIPQSQWTNCTVFDPRRVGVVTGSAMDRDDHLPLPGVQVTVKDHPEYGYTATRVDGRFDLAVNGGGTFILEFTRGDRLDVQRQVRVPWNDYAPEIGVEMVTPSANSTSVDFDSQTSIVQFAEGDQEGSGTEVRTPVVIFRSGTQATLHHSGSGDTQAGTEAVRLTEYTTHDADTNAMPADLPSNSAYTYAIDVSMDGSTGADFQCDAQSQNCPPFYVDNFLDFPIGDSVPVGYYDKEKGAWLPLAYADGTLVNGIVVAITGDDGNGAVTVNDDGTGKAQDLEERQALYQAYGSTPRSLWRIPLPHFSEIDANWPYGAPECSAGGPCAGDDPKDPAAGSQPVNNCRRSDAEGSIIQCENQVIGEEVPVAGTPFTLHYQSNRAKGHTADNHLLIHLLGSRDPAPSELQRIDYSVTVAGQTYERSKGPDSHPYPPSSNRDFWPDETVPFADWDGKDRYGRDVNGPQPAHVVVSEVYKAVYKGAQGFGNYAAPPGPNPPAAFTTERDRYLVKVTREYDTTIGGYRAAPEDLGGWTLDVHHAYDIASQTLLLGNGDERSSRDSGNIITQVAANLDSPSYLAAAPNGDVYFSGYPFYVYRVTPDGNVSVVAGDGNSSTLWVPMGLAVGPDDALYIADHNNNRIRRVDLATGQMTTYAGVATKPTEESEDGTPTDTAWVDAPTAVAVAPDGTVYFAEDQTTSGFGYRIRKISPGLDAAHRFVTTVAGNGGDLGTGGDSSWSDPEPATNANIGNAIDIALAPDGSLYFSTQPAYGAVWKVGSDGNIRRVAGKNNQVSGWADNVQAKGCQMDEVFGIDVAFDGTLLACVGRYYVRKVGDDGIIHVLAGNGTDQSTGDNGLATAAGLDRSIDAVARPDGSIWVSDTNNGAIRQIKRALPGPPATQADTIVVASADGRQQYIFDSKGRHLRTLNTLTGQAMYTFDYDPGSHLLSKITDGDNNETGISRNGSTIDITAPHDQVTELALDSNNYVSNIHLPTGQDLKPELDANGLMSAFTDAQGKKSLMYYDSEGRLTSEYDADVQELGGSKTLSRDVVDNDPRRYQVTFSTHLGRTSTYDVSSVPSGTGTSADPVLVSKETKTDPAGNQTDYSTDSQGVVTKTLPDGTKIIYTPAPDPIGGMQVQGLGTVVTTLPNSPSISRTVTTTRSTDTGWSETRTVNGNAFTKTFTTQGGQYAMTIATPAGHGTRTEYLDSQGRVTKMVVPSLSDTLFAYDQGRLKTVTQGSRTRDVTSWDAQGYPSVIVDAAGHTTNLESDAFGRVTRLQQDAVQGGLNLNTYFGYDGAGDLTSVSLPNNHGHDQQFTLGQRIAKYTAPPPAAGDASLVTRYLYNADRQNTSIVTPDGTITRDFDPTTGRLSQTAGSDVAWPKASVAIGYDYVPSGSGAGHLGEADATTTYWDTSEQAVNTSFSYDGHLLTGVDWSWTFGTSPVTNIDVSLLRTYNDDFRVEGEKFARSGVDYWSSFGYDADGLLTCAASTGTQWGQCDTASPRLDVERNGPMGAVSVTNIGQIGDTWEYNTYGELAHYTVSGNGATLYEVTYDSAGHSRDGLGRVLHKRETRMSDSTSPNTDYTYDAANRLKSVQVDGGTVENFDYDNDGNRVAAGATTYDDDDRLTEWNGNSAYEWTANGELWKRTDSSTGVEQKYFYDRFGDLVDYVRSGSNAIEIRYALDGLRRRVQRRIAGSQTATERYFYLDRLRLGAVVHQDDQGNLNDFAYFIYGTRSNIPDLVVNYHGGTGTLYRIISDQLGSPHLVVNVNDATDQPFKADYDAWGNSTRIGDPTANEANWALWFPFDFAGGLYDPDTKLVHFGARDYDPEVGRWTNRDPILFDGGQGNLYVYVGDDPVNTVDSTGYGVDRGNEAGKAPNRCIADEECLECRIVCTAKTSACVDMCKREAPDSVVSCIAMMCSTYECMKDRCPRCVNE